MEVYLFHGACLPQVNEAKSISTLFLFYFSKLFHGAARRGGYFYSISIVFLLGHLLPENQLNRRKSQDKSQEIGQEFGAPFFGPEIGTKRSAGHGERK